MADTVQEVLQDYPFKIEGGTFEGIENSGMAFSSIMALGAAGHLAPPYWSKVRDKWLIDFARRIDVIKITVKTFISKANTIPVRIYPLDRSIKRHQTMADDMYDALMRNSGLFKGFRHEFQKFLWDYLNQDNGAFFYILGGGSADGPIVGSASGLVHLESYLCNRTSNPEYPVVYYHPDGKRYKIHYTRLIDMVSLPSTEHELRGVGLCPTSLCIDSAQEILDMYVYSQEKHGSRPARQILYASEGATVDQLSQAVQHGEMKLNQEGLSRFAKTLLLAPKLPGGKLKLEVIDLASSPDGFDRQQVTLLDMAVIAASFGLDLRDLAHSFGISGQTRSDAEVQDRKGRGKGVGEFIEAFGEQLSQKFLPPYLAIGFDNADDNQDEQQAKIANMRSTSRGRDVATGIMTVRASRQQMLRVGEITDIEFDEMELEDGRLPDGNDILSLFYSSDPYYAKWLKVRGLEDPIDIDNNDPYQAVDAIKPALVKAWNNFEEETNTEKRKKARNVIKALETLQNEYRGISMQQEQMMAQQASGAPTNEGSKSPDGGVSESNAGKKPGQGVGQSGQPPFPASQTKEGVSVNSAVILPSTVNYDESHITDALTLFAELYPAWAGLLDGTGRWVYDETAKRYRNTETGRLVGDNQIDRLADNFDPAFDGYIDNLTDLLSEENADLQRWVDEFIAMLAVAFINYYLLGIGGQANMTSERWQELQGLMDNQLGYMQGFANDIQTGSMSLAQLAARTAMYFASAAGAYHHAKATRYGLILPAYPRDHSTRCKSYCRCRWDIKEFEDRWEATWKLGLPLTEHCEDCVTRSQTWKPYVVYKS